MKEQNAVSPEYDVIVAGAGPAGALTAYYLAAAGKKVLILEKERLPRYKACGGGLTPRAFDALPFDISPVVVREVSNALMLHNNRPVFSHSSGGKSPLFTMVMRDRFDHYLVEQAVAMGARLREGARFESVAGPAGNLRVTTSRGEFTTRLLVGADGVNGRVAKALGLTISTRYMTALEGELYPGTSLDLERFKNTLHYDFGVIPGGYGWVFPKGDHLSVGVGTFAQKATGINRAFESYLSLKGLSHARKIDPLKGHLIPTLPRKAGPVSCDRGLVVGDAAGYGDPLTGEGLYFAFTGAKMAADTLAGVLETGRFQTMAGYDARLKKAFFRELTAAHVIAGMLYAVPGLSRRILFAQGRELGKSQLDVVSGRLTYTKLLARLLLRIMNPIQVLSVLFR
ncbi:MAG: geranylgeranyl reductase family protein [Desulfobacteraceae bacterium]|nr:geranylgeranyl reductase family protein [Desulfobacteraceae bacterium]